MARPIRVLHLEPTDVCQAACPACARETDPEFDQAKSHHLTIAQIEQHLSLADLRHLDKMFMCGNYGDPAAAENAMDIYQWFRNCNPDIVLGMNTNGGIQTSFWWHELGSILNQPQDYAVFSIDGLSDTNGVYRKNVNWDKAMTNIEAFIAAGGSAHWDMLVYRHNQHQVDECERLAKRMGFKWFRAKVSKRGFTDRLEAPIGWANPRTQGTKINCHALNEHSVYIDAQGRMSPCCWLGARQQDFVTDFDEVKNSWASIQPNIVCLDTCGTVDGNTSFSNQWQREVQL